MSTTHSIPEVLPATFPKEEVKAKLRREFTRLDQDLTAMRDPWLPILDSMAIVGVMSAVESVVPGLEIAPEKVVRKGGYSTVEEAVDDVANRIQRRWFQKNNR